MALIKYLTLIVVASLFIGCEESSDCYLCEKEQYRYIYCEDVLTSPNQTFDEVIRDLRANGYECDYYKD